MDSTTTHPAAVLALVLLSALGCASAPPPAPEPPPQAASGTLAARRGPRVHIANADLSKPLALYSYEPTNVGGRYVSPTIVLDPIGGREIPVSKYVVVDEGVERFLCLAPCDREVVVSFGHELFLGGEGITPSDRFRLDAGLEPVDVEAVPGSVHRTRGGTLLVVIGGLATLVATPVLPIAATRQDSTGTAVGAGLMGGGVALLAAGIPLLITGKTRYVLRRPEVVLRF